MFPKACIQRSMKAAKIIVMGACSSCTFGNFFFNISICPRRKIILTAKVVSPNVKGNVSLMT